MQGVEAWKNKNYAGPHPKRAQALHAAEQMHTHKAVWPAAAKPDASAMPDYLPALTLSYLGPMYDAQGVSTADLKQEAERMQGMSKAAMKGYLERLEEKVAEAAAAKKKERYIEIPLGADPTAGCPMQ